MAISPDETVVGFVGIGRMGAEVARVVLGAGYRVLVTSRHREHARVVVEDGAEWVDDRTELVGASDVVITMLGFPEDVEDAYLGDDNLLDAARPGTYFIDMTTSSPKLAHVISTMAAVDDLHAIDAPVAGDELQARRGSLDVMVGGDKADFDALAPILDAIGSPVNYIGEAGSGQLMKLATTIAYASTLMGVVESLAFARATGLDEDRLADVVRGSNVDSWLFSNLYPKMCADELYDGIHVKHFCKDLGLALQLAEAYDLTLPGLDVASSLYNLLNASGGAELAVQALVLVYSDEEACLAHGLSFDGVDADAGGSAHLDSDDDGTDGGPEGYEFHRHAHEG